MNKLIQLRILSKKLGGSFFCLSENRSQCSHNSFFVVPTFLHSLFPVYDTSTPKVTDHILPHAVLNTHVHQSEVRKCGMPNYFAIQLQTKPIGKILKLILVGNSQKWLKIPILKQSLRFLCKWECLKTSMQSMRILTAR